MAAFSFDKLAAPEFISISLSEMELYWLAKCSDTDETNTVIQTAALLFSEYICLAIMSFPYSYSVLGLVPGLILTVVQAAFVLYTSLVTW